MSFENVKSYPLSWPEGWKRTPRGLVKRAQFNRRDRSLQNIRNQQLTIADGVARVLLELKRMGVPNWNVIISTNVPVSSQGLPLSRSSAPQDPGVAVYFKQGKNDRVIAVDIYTRVADNLAAIAATLEAMRAIERHGGAAILERAFTGFQALPAPDQAGGLRWQDVLELDPALTYTLSDCEEQYRKLRSIYHPDRPGGNAQKFQQVQRAIEQARKESRDNEYANSTPL